MTELTNTEYHKLKALGSSNIKQILKNAQIFDLQQRGSSKIEGPALDLGTYLHAQVLEPHLLITDFVLSGDFKIYEQKEKLLKLLKKEKEGFVVSYWEDACLTATGQLGKQAKALASQKNTKSLRPADIYLSKVNYSFYQFWKKNQDKIFITNEQHDLSKRLYIQLFELKGFADYLQAGTKEVVFFGVIDGVKVKIKIDLFVEKEDMHCDVIDLKTFAKEPTAKNIVDASAKYGWYIQEAFYTEVLEQNGYTVDKYLYAVTSKKEGSEWYRHPQSAIELGMDHIQKAIVKYKYCVKNNLWLRNEFDYDNVCFLDEINRDLPVWAYYQYR